MFDLPANEASLLRYVKHQCQRLTWFSGEFLHAVCFFFSELQTIYRNTYLINVSVSELLVIFYSFEATLVSLFGIKRFREI